MFVDFLIGYIGPPNCYSLMSVGSILKSKYTIQSLLSMCLYGVCSLILTLTTNQSNVRGLMKKSNYITPAYLMH